MKKCRDVMTTGVVCCVPQDSCEEAARLMKSNDVGPIPVVDSHESKRLVGIVTDRDLAMKLVAEGRDGKSCRVSEVMSRDPVSCREDDDLRDAMTLMSQHQVRRIPILDKNGRLAGIIAQADIATRTEHKKELGEVVEEISE